MSVTDTIPLITLIVLLGWALFDIKSIMFFSLSVFIWFLMVTALPTLQRITDDKAINGYRIKPYAGNLFLGEEFRSTDLKNVDITRPLCAKCRDTKL